MSVLVTVLDDVIREENETFSVSLSGSSRVSTQPTSAATVEIVDEDSECTYLLAVVEGEPALCVPRCRHHCRVEPWGLHCG